MALSAATGFFGQKSTLPTYNLNVDLNRTAIQQSFQSYDDEMRKRYELVKDKSTAELSSMGITFVDGSYWKDGKAWLAKNYIEKITGKFDPLMENGQYAYPLDIPESIMVAVVNKYSSTLSKDEMIAMARRVLKITGSNLSDDAINSAIGQVSDKAKSEDPDLGSKLTDAETNNPSGVAGQAISKTKTFFKKYGLWIIGGLVVVTVGIVIIKRVRS